MVVVKRLVALNQPAPPLERRRVVVRRKQLNRLENCAHRVDSSLAMKSILVSIVAAVVLVGCGPQPPDSSIHNAALSGHIEAVKQHIAAGTDVNAKDGWGMSPLHWAVERGRKETAELLIAKGADVNAKNDFGQTPLDRANWRNHAETADLLRKHGGKHGTIQGAVDGGDVEAVKEFLAAGADANAEDFNGNSLLFYASTTKVAELLISKGASINATNNGFTPLHWAADRGHEEVAALLIEKGLNVNAKDENRGRTPLHFSAHEGHIEVTDLLIRKEANLNAKTNDGFTPLDSTKQNDGDRTKFQLNRELLAQNRIVIADLLRKHGGKTEKELKAAGN